MKTFLSRIGKYRIMLLVLLVIFVMDRLSKWWVVSNIPYGTYLGKDGPIPVIDGFFHLVHIGNTGAAWGMFQNFSFLLGIFALITILAIFLFRRMLSLHLPSMQLAFGLLIGGILGNFYDRIFIGHIIDFIDINLQFYRWPAFNIADSAICVGVIAYIYLSFRLDGASKSALDESGERPVTGDDSNSRS